MTGFVPPIYPFDRLREITKVAQSHEGGIVDLSVGEPCERPTKAVLDALSSDGNENNYPPSAGSNALRDAAVSWVDRRFGVQVERDSLGVCIGTKELVAGLPHWLRLRSPDRDTVLYPSTAYPTYEMGALLASCRAVPVQTRSDGSLALDTIGDEDASRALCLWVNSPSNPTGKLDDLDAAAAFGRARGFYVISDECYAEFTWQGPPRSILSSGKEGVLAVHSLSKRSNAAGLRLGFYAGDEDLVHYLIELRRHAGFMVPTPIQAAGIVALEDDQSVIEQREIYLERIAYFRELLASIDVATEQPAGSFYLWIEVPERYRGESSDPDGPEWSFVRLLAERAGVLVSPGEFYGPYGKGHVRIALVEPMERLRLVETRLRQGAVS